MSEPKRPGRWNADEGCWVAVQRDLPNDTIYHHKGSHLRWRANRPSVDAERWTNWVVVDQWPDGTEPVPAPQESRRDTEEADR